MNFFDCGDTYHHKDRMRLPTWFRRSDPAKRRIIMMRLNFMLLLFLCCFVPLGLKAQHPTVTLSVKQASLINVLEQIHKQTGYKLLYDSKHFASAVPVTLNLKNSSLDNALTRCFEGQPLTYELINKNIVIKPKQDAKKPPQSRSRTTISGRVSNEEGKPILGATIKVRGSDSYANSGSDGTFSIDVPMSEAKLVVSCVGYVTLEATANNTSESSIVLKEATRQLEEFSVLSNGYQKIPKERATGSFEQVNNELLNRRVGSNILDRLENVTSGFYTNQNDVGPDKYVIRGRSTLFANAVPLIVLDNFPFDGSIDDINPNDIESITILKDAAAASIWGARAGNGVIVITTKTGQTAKPRVQLVSNVTLMGKPDLFSLRTISSADYIDLERDLFSKGYYKADEDANRDKTSFPPFTPVIEILRKQRDGQLSPLDAAARIDQLKQYDVRNDLSKYFYQKSINQQYALNVSGKTEANSYYVSAGYDKGTTNLVGENSNRITLLTRNTFQVNKRLNVEVGLNFIQNTNQAGENNGIGMRSNALKQLYPYAQLADEKGKALPLYSDFSEAFISSALSAGLLNWEKRPLDEISRRTYRNQTREMVANAGLNYKIISGLNLSLKYQYLYSNNNVNNTYDTDAYYTRDLINKFTQVATNGSLTLPIPLGAILSQQNRETFSHQARAQLSYEKDWTTDHQLTVLAGWEIKDLTAKGSNNVFYGYDKMGSVTNSSLNYTQKYPQYQYGTLAPFVTASIPNGSGISGTYNRFLSSFANASYRYKSRYILSGSIREDASNLFGVSTNQKQVPLWSAGLGWQIDKENFYKMDWLPILKLRATYGLQGNYSQQASAYTTGSFTGSSGSLHTLPKITVRTAPNARLRWETTRMLNLGLDFVAKNDILSGTIEYFTKRGFDLLGNAPLDPTTGITPSDEPPKFFGNVASMKGHGVDLKLSSTIINREFNWTANFLYSYVLSTVTKYEVPVSAFGNAYLGDFLINPVEGKNVYSIFAFKAAGLDPANGNPRGYLNGTITDDFAAMYARTPLSEMNTYALQPTSFGSLRNNFSYKNLSLSFNISYKFGYYLRKPSINYYQLFSTWSGSSDYANRWQKPGDELVTNIPSMVYPASDIRDTYFGYTDALIAKADHIRLEDINVAYELNKSKLAKLPLESIRFYSYISNLGVLWKANKVGIDPNNVLTPTPAQSFAFGINVTF